MGRRLDRPAGFFQTCDAEGNLIEGETRKCSHCGFQWIYLPGSGAKRGFCLKCMGLLCGAQSCMNRCLPEEKRLEIVEKIVERR